MSAYSFALANARLDAINRLVDVLNTSEDAAETRRCAIAILNAPDPCDLDDEIELDDDDADEDDEDNESSEADEPEGERNDPPSHSPPNPHTPAQTSAASAPSAPPPAPPSIAPQVERRCHVATPTSNPQPAPRTTPFLPAPTTPASTLIAIAGTTTPRPSG